MSLAQLVPAALLLVAVSAQLLPLSIKVCCCMGLA